MTTTPEHLRANLRDAADELLRAEHIESASIPMGDRLILIGPPASLGRMLGYSGPAGLIAGELLGRQTAAFLAATGRAPDRLADHGSAEWELFIAGYELGARLAASAPAPIKQGGDHD